jgi:hypothetical protein
MRRFFLSLIVVVVVCVLAGTWRLRRGPIAVDFMLPEIERALNPPDADLQVDIAGAVVEWGGWRQPLGLGLRRVRVRQASGATVAELPAVTLGFSGRALLGGALAPAWIQITGAELRLEREPGAVVRPATPVETESGDDTLLIDLLLHELGGVADATGQFGFLESVRIVRGLVHVADLQSGRELEATFDELDLVRDARGIAGSVEAEANLGRTTLKLAATFLYAIEEETAHAALSLDGLDIAALSFLFPEELRQVIDVDMILEGSASARIGASGAVREATFDLGTETGTVAVPSLWAEGQALQNLRVTGRLQPKGLSIERAALDLPGERGQVTRLMLSGSALQHDGATRLNGEARIGGLNVEALGRYWPESTAASARRWVVANIHSGSVENVVVAATVDLPGTTVGGARLKELQGTFDYDQLDVSAATALPTARRLSGEATLTSDEMHFRIDAGRLGELSLEEGAVAILRMGSGSERIDVTVGAVGSSEAILDVVAPDVIDALGVQRSLSTESAWIRGEFRIPLQKVQDLDDVDAEVTAQLPGLVVDNALVAGRLRADVQLLGKGDGPAVVETDFVLTESVVRFPVLGEHRAPPGTEGRARATMQLEDGRPSVLSSFELESGQVRVRGGARFGQQGTQLTGVDLAELQVDGTSLSGVHVRFEEPAVRVEVDGGVLNVASLTSAGAGGKTEVEAAVRTPFSLTAPQLQRVSFAADRFLEDVAVAISRDGRGWSEVSLAGRVPEGLRSKVAAGVDKKPGGGVSGVFPVDQGQFEIDWRREGHGGSRLRAHVQDTGGLLRAVSFVDAVEGGALQASGSASAASAEPLQAHVRAGAFSVTSSSLLFRLLNLASGRGILDRPRGDHITFDELTGNVSWTEDVIRFADVTARGAVVAVTMAGTVDVESATMELGGEIITAYELTRLLNAVPLLGAIRIGDQGLVGVVYRASGPLREPSLSVDPVTSLTPGLLRRLLGTEPGNPNASGGRDE